MKFDPNATPECDFNENESLFTCVERTGSFNFARIFERRARVAEEKLRIATDALTRITLGDSNNFFTIMTCLDVLKKIEGVGK